MNAIDEGLNLPDWFDKLSEDQQQDILEGIAQADRAETVSHAEAVELFSKWGLK